MLLNSIADLANATVDAAVTARDLAQKNVDAEQQKSTNWARSRLSNCWILRRSWQPRRVRC